MKSKVTGNANLWEETLQKILRKKGGGWLGAKAFIQIGSPH